jgi:hypothetical protein
MTLSDLPIWKSAIRQVGKPALQSATVGFILLTVV